MKTTIKVFAIIGVVIGSLAIIGSAESSDFYAFICGALFLAWGIIDLVSLAGLRK
jgi:uncharacterized membrane protein HdeD (DUF308 family)